MNTQTTLEALRTLLHSPPSPNAWESLHNTLIKTRQDPALAALTRDYTREHIADWDLPYTHPKSVWSYWRSASLQLLHIEDPWMFWSDLQRAWLPTPEPIAGCSNAELQATENELHTPLPKRVRSWYARFGLATMTPPPQSTPDDPEPPPFHPSYILPPLDALTHAPNTHTLLFGPLDLYGLLPIDPPLHFALDLSDPNLSDPPVVRINPTDPDDTQPHPFAPSFSAFLLFLTCTFSLTLSPHRVDTDLNHLPPLHPNSPLFDLQPLSTIALPDFPSLRVLTAPNTIALLLGFSQDPTAPPFALSAAHRLSHKLLSNYLPVIL